MERVKIPAKEKIGTKLQLDAAVALKLFQPLFKTINASTVLPILEDVLVERENGFTSYSVTDLETTTSITMEDNGNPTVFMFPGIELRYLIQNHSEPEIAVTLSKDLHRPHICAKNGGFTLNMEAHSYLDFPKLIAYVGEGKSFSIDAKEFLPDLEYALTYVSGDSLRPAMTGVCLKDIKGVLTMAATDAHRMYWRGVCKTPKQLKDNAIILPAKSCRIMLMALKKKEAISVSVDENYFRVEKDEAAITCRLLDAKYPNFEAIIPDRLPLTININRKELRKVLQMCMPFTNKSTGMVALSVYPDRIDISGGDDDFSIDFKHSIKLSGTSVDTFAPFQFGMNVKFLLPALDRFKTELVKIDSPMVGTQAIIVDDCVLIMPLMLNA